MICLGWVPAHGMRVRLVPPTVCSMRWPVAASMPW